MLGEKKILAQATQQAAPELRKVPESYPLLPMKSKSHVLPSSRGRAASLSWSWTEVNCGDAHGSFLACTGSRKEVEVGVSNLAAQLVGVAWTLLIHQLEKGQRNPT